MPHAAASPARRRRAPLPLWLPPARSLLPLLLLLAAPHPAAAQSETTYSMDLWPNFYNSWPVDASTLLVRTNAGVMYANNMDVSLVVFAPNTIAPTQRLSVTVVSFSTESGHDYFSIYGTASTATTPLVRTSGGLSVGMTYASTDTTGVAFRFTSDVSQAFYGVVVRLAIFTPPTPSITLSPSIAPPVTPSRTSTRTGSQSRTPAASRSPAWTPSRSASAYAEAPESAPQAPSSGAPPRDLRGPAIGGAVAAVVLLAVVVVLMRRRAARVATGNGAGLSNADSIASELVWVPPTGLSLRDPTGSGTGVESSDAVVPLQAPLWRSSPSPDSDTAVVVAVASPLAQLSPSAPLPLPAPQPQSEAGVPPQGMVAAREPRGGAAHIPRPHGPPPTRAARGAYAPVQSRLLPSREPVAAPSPPVDVPVVDHEAEQAGKAWPATCGACYAGLRPGWRFRMCADSHALCTGCALQHVRTRLAWTGPHGERTIACGLGPRQANVDSTGSGETAIGDPAAGGCTRRTLKRTVEALASVCTNGDHDAVAAELSGWAVQPLAPRELGDFRALAAVAAQQRAAAGGTSSDAT